jgi:hypothetical protein
VIRNFNKLNEVLEKDGGLVTYADRVVRKHFQMKGEYKPGGYLQIVF